MISDFHRESDENCALLGHYAASSGKFLPTFRDNISVPSTGVFLFLTPEDGSIGCPETSVRNNYSSLLNDPEEPISHRHYAILIGLGSIHRYENAKVN